MNALVMDQLLRVPFNYYLISVQNGAPRFTTCPYCDRVLRGIDYGLGLEAVYPSDMGFDFEGDYFMDFPGVAYFVGIRIAAGFRPDGVGKARGRHYNPGWDVKVTA